MVAFNGGHFYCSNHAPRRERKQRRIERISWQPQELRRSQRRHQHQQHRHQRLARQYLHLFLLLHQQHQRLVLSHSQ